MPPRKIQLALLLAAAAYGCASAGGSVSTTPAVAGALPATSTLRLNVINLTGKQAPFVFRLGGIQVLDTIAPSGTLNFPVMNRAYQMAPGSYQMQLYARESRKLAQDSLVAGRDGTTHATVELIFDDDGARLSLCYCVRIYGSGTGSN